MVLMALEVGQRSPSEVIHLASARKKALGQLVVEIEMFRISSIPKNEKFVKLIQLSVTKFVVT